MVVAGRGGALPDLLARFIRRLRSRSVLGRLRRDLFVAQQGDAEKHRDCAESNGLMGPRSRIHSALHLMHHLPRTSYELALKAHFTSRVGTRHCPQRVALHRHDES